MTPSSRRARKRDPLPLPSQPKISESILQMTPSPQSPPSLQNPRKTLRARRKRRRMPIQMTISSMRKTITLKKSCSLREETTMTSSGMMMAISHNLPKRKRRRRSRSQHLTQASILVPLTPPLLLEETKEYKRKELEVVPSEVNQWSVRKSKISVVSISR
jgi:hypothetical protein